MPSQILYRGPLLCWSLLFLSNCFTCWECSQRFSQSYSLHVMQTESTCKKQTPPPQKKREEKGRRDCIYPTRLLTNTLACWHQKAASSGSSLQPAFPFFALNLAIIPGATHSTSSSPFSHPSLIQHESFDQRGASSLCSVMCNA